MHLPDIYIDTKAMEKLIEVVSNAIGILYEPRQLVRMAHAEAKSERIKAIEHAKTEAMLANNIEQLEQLTTIEKRLLLKETKRQENIEKIVAIAAKEIRKEPEVSEQAISPDWSTRFFDIAQDISDEQMQDLWGRILAGEIRKPGSYSLRTLDSLRSISAEEAELFEEMANFVLFDGLCFIFNGYYHRLEKLGIMYYKIAQLIEAGFIQPGNLVSHHFYLENNQPTTHYLTYANYMIKVEQPVNLANLSMPVYILTQMGREIYELIQPKPNLDYLSQIAEYLKKNKDIKIYYAPILGVSPDGEINIDDDSFVEL